MADYDELWNEYAEKNNDKLESACGGDLSEGV